MYDVVTFCENHLSESSYSRDVNTTVKCDGCQADIEVLENMVSF